MALYSSQSANKKKSFLPAIDNGPTHKHSADLSSKENDLRQQKKFPEVMTDTTKNVSTSFARKYSSTNKTFQTKEMLKSGQGKAGITATRKKRGSKFYLPPLAVTPAEGVKPVESWSNALGLRESFEIPRSFFNKLSDEILKIDRQLREEARLQQIRERRRIPTEWREYTMPPKLSLFESTFEHTSSPQFSYFPSITSTAAQLERPESVMPNPRTPKNIDRELINQQELEIQRKMNAFKHRHSHSKHKALK